MVDNIKAKMESFQEGENNILLNYYRHSSHTYTHTHNQSLNNLLGHEHQSNLTTDIFNK